MQIYLPFFVRERIGTILYSFATTRLSNFEYLPSYTKQDGISDHLTLAWLFVYLIIASKQAT